MKKLPIKLLVLWAVAAICACLKVDAPHVEPDSIVLEKEYKDSYDVNALNNEIVIAFVSNVDWSASTKDSWVSISPKTGKTGLSKVKINVENNEGEERSTSVEFTAGEAQLIIRVNQSAPEKVPDEIVLSEGCQREQTVSCSEGEIRFDFVSNVDWKASTQDSWITLSPDNGSAGQGSILVGVETNEGEERTANIVVCAGEATLELCVIQEEKPDIFLTAIDLSSIESSNCYMLTEPNFYKIKAVKGNGTEPVEAVSAALMWEMSIFGGDHAIVAADIVVKDGYIYFTTTGTEGSAGIAALDASGKVLWSWHIWSLKENPDINIGGIVAQKFSLGYIPWEANDAYSFGLLYQWGRKDPFPVNFATVNQSYPGYEYSSVKNTDVLENDNTMAYSIAHPTAFIKADDNSCDWYACVLETQNNELWGEEKTINDPCPVGYRVAGSDFYKAFDASKFVFEITPDATPAHRRIVYDNGVTEFYYSGNYDFDKDYGLWQYSGGWYWSHNIPDGSPFASSAWFLGGYEPEKAYYRGNAMAVRCVKK